VSACSFCAPFTCLIYAAVPAPVEDQPTRPLRLVQPGAVPEREIHDETTICARCRRRVTECICK
jgi:hypothetical protein